MSEFEDSFESVRVGREAGRWRHSEEQFSCELQICCRTPSKLQRLELGARESCSQ